MPEDRADRGESNLTNGADCAELEFQRWGHFPSLGDARKIYTVELTEPEINVIHEAYGFSEAELAGLRKLSGANHPGRQHIESWWRRCGPVLQNLSSVTLAQFDDGDAPFDESRSAATPVRHENHQAAINEAVSP